MSPREGLIFQFRLPALTAYPDARSARIAGQFLRSLVSVAVTAMIRKGPRVVMNNLTGLRIDDRLLVEIVLAIGPHRPL